MPSIKWNVLVKNPITLLKILALASSRTTILLLLRIIFPFRYRQLTLRNALARDWIRTAFQANSDIFCSEPWRHECQEVVLPGKYVSGKKVVGGWVVPSTERNELKGKDAVVLFAHGGGFALGHGLQNLGMFKRLSGKAKKMGQDVAFVSVKYREFALRGPICFPTIESIELTMPTVQHYPSRNAGPLRGIHTWLCMNGYSTKACQHPRLSSPGQVPVVRRTQANRLKPV